MKRQVLSIDEKFREDSRRAKKRLSNKLREEKKSKKRAENLLKFSAGDFACPKGSKATFNNTVEVVEMKGEWGNDNKFKARILETNEVGEKIYTRIHFK